MRAAPPTASTWLAALVVCVGAVALAAGWYGVSGETSVAEQMPYLASASLPGVALVVAGTILLSADAERRRRTPTEQRIAELHALLVEEDEHIDAAARATEAPAPGGRRLDEGLVTVAGTRHYHRSSCALVADRPTRAVTAATVADLAACPVCEPTPVEP